MSGRVPPRLAETRRRLRTTTMESGRADPFASVEVAEVESQLIANLQQQVQYLELETQLLKKKAYEPRPQMKERATETGPSIDPALQRARHLDDHMNALKLKYVDQEDQFTARMDMLEDQNGELNRDLEEARALIDQLRAELHSERVERACEVEAHEESESQMRTRTVAAERKSEMLTDDLSQRKSQIEALEIRTAELNGELRASSQTCAALNASKGDLEATVKLQADEIDLLKGEIAKKALRLDEFGGQVTGLETLQHEFQGWRHECEKASMASVLEIRRLEMELEQAKASVTATEGINKRLTEENANMQATLETAIEEAKLAKAELRLVEDRLVHHRSLVEQTQIDRDQFASERSNLNGEIDRLRSEARDQANELAEARRVEAELRHDLSEYSRVKSEMTSHTHTLASDLTAARTALETMTRQHTEAKTQLDTITTAHEQLEEELALTKGRLEAAEKELDVARSIKQTKLREMKQVKEANLLMAQQISTLLSTIGDIDDEDDDDNQSQTK